MAVEAVEIAERRMLLDRAHQVGLGVSRQLADVVQPPDVGGRDAVPAPVRPVERHLPRERHDRGEPALLQGAQLVPAHAREPRQELRPDRIVAAQRREVHRVKVVHRHGPLG
jgi:hypothetical protein